MSSLSFGKISVSNGKPKYRSRINVGGTTATTFDFGNNQIVSCVPLMPGDKLSKITISHNIRMSPLVAPTIGKCNVKFDAFFVPNRLAFEGFEQFMNSEPWYNAGGAVTPALPFLTNVDLVNAFTGWTGFREDYTLLDRHGRGVPVVDPYPTSIGNNEVVYYDGKNGALLPVHTNTIDTSMITTPFTEIVGICKGFDTKTGKPKGFLRVHKSTNGGYATVELSEDEYLDYSNGARYDGEDYDVVSLVSMPSSTSGSTQNFVILPWQVKGYQFTNGSGETERLTSNIHYVLFRFTRLGKKVYSNLLAMGYAINFCCPNVTSDLEVNAQASPYKFLTGWDSQASVSCQGNGFSSDKINPTDSHTTDIWVLKYDGSTYNDYIDNTVMNALKINGFLRVFIDYLAPTQFLRSYLTLLEHITHENGFVWTGASLRHLRHFLTASYSQDYFTSAWQAPNAPVLGQGNVGANVANQNTLTSGIQVFETFSSETQNGPVNAGNGTNIIGSTNDGNKLRLSSSNYTISQVALDALRALTKWRRLNNVAGVRWIDKQLARFGVRPSDARVDRAEFLGTKSSEFDISLITSTADTTTANLGDYAAHGESRNSLTIDGIDEVTEWGHLYIVLRLLPKAMYFQGRSRDNKVMKSTDWYVPEFDEIDSMTAIAQDELYCDNKAGLMLGMTRSFYSPDSVFGYTRTYPHLKLGRDNVLGDFRLQSRGKYTTMSYLLCREIPDLAYNYTSQRSLINDNEFNIASDATQYDRIFQAFDGEYDHFFMFSQIDINVSRCIKSITDFTMDNDDDSQTRKLSLYGTQV